MVAPWRRRSWVSIHAPVKGATRGLRIRINRTRGFNPRPREGGDRQVRREPEPTQVSIHAPVKGATTRSPRSEKASRSFNPRPREGGDVEYLGELEAKAQGFNPRPREGGDKFYDRDMPEAVKFQSTPP